MNKISKKIVSLITMAAFVLTLVPAAAFADTSKAEAGTTVTVTDVDYETAKVDIQVGPADFKDLQDTAAQNTNIVVWATDGENKVVPNTDVTYTLTDGTAAKMWTPTGEPGNDFAVLSAPATVKDLVSVNATFVNPGTYTLHAAINTALATDLAGMQAQEIGKGDVFSTRFANEEFSYYGVIANNSSVEETATVNIGKALTTGFLINAADTYGTTDELDNVVVWAEENGKVSNNVTFSNAAGNLSTIGTTDNVFSAGSVDNKTELKATFSKAGTYTLHAGVGTSLTQARQHDLNGTTTVTVTNKDVAAAKIVDAEADIDNVGTKAIPFKNGIGDLDLTGTNFSYDGIDKITIKGTVVDEDGNPVVGKKITATTNKDSVVEMDGNAASDVTDNFGEFEITFVMQDQSNATVTLTDEDNNISYTIQIWAKKTTADNIDRTLTGGYVLAGNDSKYGDDVYGGNAKVSFADAVQFKVTGDGEEMTGDAAIAGSKIDVRTVPSGSTLKDNNKTTVNGDSTNVLALVWDKDNGVYTLAYTGATYATDLIPGKYEVRVALANGDDATVTFNVAKFGKVQDTVLDITARDYDQSPANPNEEVMSVDDTITLGQQVTVTAKYVDGNGIKVPAKYVSFNFNGKAVSDWSKWNNVFATQMDIPANESLIGTTVKVVAFNTANKQLVEKTLTVADSYTDKSLEFSSDNGSISKDNKVNVSVVNEDGKVQQVEGYMTAWVADQSNEDAKISVDVNKNGVHDVQNGKGSLTVYADQETTADIVVVVKAGTEAYYGTLEYTFGSENAIANRTVVMTIDSTDYVVNNKIFTGDAAPYIDSNWRTMVPIRALAEAFDAEVIWNQDDSTVTINFDGDTQIVMTVGETAYTVDGAEATMDTEPVNAGDRVYVPVRFAAEGLGFSVLPLYNEAGLTASVVFQK